MNLHFRTILAAAMLAFGTVGCMSPKGDTPLAKCKYVDHMRQETLAEFAVKRPGLDAKLQEASGYAVFNRRSFSLLHFGTRKAYGVLHDNGTGQDTYMRMFGGTVCIAIGLEKGRDLLLFDTPESLQGFLNGGWETAAALTLTLKPLGHGFASGGYVTSVGGEKISEVDKGIRVGVSLGLGRFYEDDELNAAKPAK